MLKQLRWERSLLGICKILGLFVKTFTADGKCFLLNRDNLRKPIQIQLSEQEKKFPEFFCAILISTINFEHFQNEIDPHS